MEQYVGQLQLFAFEFAPKDWAICAGQTLQIQQYQQLYSVVGTLYGGDGLRTFRLPDLQGKLVVGVGQRPGSSNYDYGQSGGAETVALSENELPQHGHSFNATSVQGTTATAAGNQLAVSQFSGKSGGAPGATAAIYSPNPGSATVGLAGIGFTGGDKPHTNMQPSLTLNYCIALVGIYPPRPPET